MKQFLNLFTKNWIPKLLTLGVAVIIWFLINNQVNYEPRYYHRTLSNDTWTD